MRIRTWQADLLLIAVAAVWGATFPLVKNATDLSAGGVPTYWFLAARFTLAALLLGVVFHRRVLSAPAKTWGAGALIGLFLFAGYAFQTFGMAYTSSSKAGFITGLCVVMVPVLSVLWLRRKPDPGAWIGVGVATFGLAMLSLEGSLIPTYGDFLVFLGAIGFALHIVAVSRYAGPNDPVALAIIQIGAAAVFSWVMHVAEFRTLGPGVPGVVWTGGEANVLLAWLICGLLATAMAFLLQNVLQPHTTPTHTALIFATEPVFGAIFSFLLLGEIFSMKGYVGGALILVGMILAELPLKFGRSSTPAQVGD